MGAPGTTDGPWTVDRYGTVVGPDGRTIVANGFASVCNAGDWQEIAKRNGRQAAASGALYDALEAIVGCITLGTEDGQHTVEISMDVGDRVPAARAALALARGEGK